MPRHPSRELGWDDIRHKFLDCAEHGGVDSTAKRAFDAFTRLEQCPDADALVRPLIMG